MQSLIANAKRNITTDCSKVSFVLNVPFCLANHKVKYMLKTGQPTKNSEQEALRGCFYFDCSTGTQPMSTKKVLADRT